jgi:hypothetical protein
MARNRREKRAYRGAGIGGILASELIRDIQVSALSIARGGQRSACATGLPADDTLLMSRRESG